MKTIIMIPSRMASTRFPGKPLAKINGIPMIQRVWQQAVKSEVGDVFVACSEKNSRTDEQFQTWRPRSRAAPNELFYCPCTNEQIHF